MASGLQANDHRGRRKAAIRTILYVHMVCVFLERWFAVTGHPGLSLAIHGVSQYTSPGEMGGGTGKSCAGRGCWVIESIYIRAIRVLFQGSS